MTSTTCWTYFSQVSCSGSLDHDADKRLGAGLTDQDAARVAQSLAYGLDGGLHIGVILRGLLCR